ncbi:MAG: 4Fe-4S binding protein [Deltaproteobacteria bacterium]|nr:4Fe-4S binding protein [Deltaproteobacteria bacterium]
MEKSNNQPAISTGYSSWRELPHIPVSIPCKGSIGETGKWRTFRPVLDAEACIKCGICYLYCPDGVILYQDDAVPEIDYTYCKGCGICVTVCPKKALEMVQEQQ